MFPYHHFCMHITISTVVTLREQVADLLHELVVLVIKFNVSTLGPDLFLMELFFGRLGVLLVVKNDQGRTSSLAIEFLDKDDGFIDTSMSPVELDDISRLDLVGQTPHDKGSLLVVGSDILGEFNCLPVVESTTRAIFKN